MSKFNIQSLFTVKKYVELKTAKGELFKIRPATINELLEVIEIYNGKDSTEIVPQILPARIKFAKALLINDDLTPVFNEANANADVEQEVLLTLGTPILDYLFSVAFGVNDKPQLGSEEDLTDTVKK